MSLDDRLEVELSEVTSRKGSTSPTLELDIVIRTTSNNSYIVDDLHAESKFSFPAHSKRIDGPTIHVNAVRIEEIDKRGANHLPVVLELDHDDLEQLEDIREGENIVIEIEFWIKGRRSKDKDFERGHFSLTKEVMSAEWTSFLDTMEYHDGRSFRMDLETSDPTVRDTIRTAHGNISEAERKHDQGDYPGAVVECRRAVETLRTLDKELDGLIDERKRSDLDDLKDVMERKYLGGLAHSEDKTNIKRPLRRDSDFALGITKSCARYVSTILEEEVRDSRSG